VLISDWGFFVSLKFCTEVLDSYVLLNRRATTVPKYLVPTRLCQSKRVIAVSTPRLIASSTSSFVGAPGSIKSPWATQARILSSGSFTFLHTPSPSVVMSLGVQSPYGGAGLHSSFKRRAAQISCSSSSGVALSFFRRVSSVPLAHDR
jgi:hypothetical protein